MFQENKLNLYLQLHDTVGAMEPRYSFPVIVLTIIDTLPRGKFL